MARSKKDHPNTGSSERSSGNARRQFGNPLTWVNPYLDKDDQQWLLANSDKLPDVVCEFLDGAPETVSISSKVDHQSGRWLASVVCSPDDIANANHAVSMRGSTRLDALYALAYVCDFKLKWEFTDGGSTDAPGRWG